MVAAYICFSAKITHVVSCGTLSLKRGLLDPCSLQLEALSCIVVATVATKVSVNEIVR